MGKGVLKETCVCPAKDVSVVGVELYVDNLLVVGAINGDSGGEFEFDWGVRGGYHSVCVRVLHEDDEVGELCGYVLTKMGCDVGAIRGRD